MWVMPAKMNRNSATSAGPSTICTVRPTQVGTMGSSRSISALRPKRSKELPMTVRKTKS